MQWPAWFASLHNVSDVLFYTLNNKLLFNKNQSVKITETNFSSLKNQFPPTYKFPRLWNHGSSASAGYTILSSNFKWSLKGLKISKFSKMCQTWISYQTKNCFIDIVDYFSSHIDQVGMDLYTGWPRINGTVDTVDFQGFALINN